uniref:Cadherin domain-containing protein n=2 Tax=Sphaeramia orbicularis TaxID=375764 RepID=A0A673BM47_9TELE
MTVRDLDKNAKIELSLDGPDKDLFFVEPQLIISEGSVQLQVKQPENVDFEKKHEANLQVVAVDQEKTTFRSTAEVTIKIIDTNDHSPQFPQSTYKLNVSEHSPEGTVLAIITAEDPDTMDQGNITYRLLPESILPYFDVEPHTGEVYVKDESPLDRELRSLFIVTLQAVDSDGKPGTTVLEITVTDINDQRPVPNRDSYLVFVKEGENFEEQIQATDADEPNTPNSQIVYSIIPSEYSNNFTIDPNTGVLRNKGELDREALDPQLDGIIELTVKISDKGTPPLSDLVNVTINLEDINDNGPEFEAPSYSFSVKEGEKGGFVGSVFAVDKDQTSGFNRISFSIVNGGFGSFIIRTYQAENLQNGYMGNITVDPDIELDYESSNKQFTLKVEAADLGQKKAELTVDVKVLDVNDERPEFIPSEVVSVEENMSDPDYVVGTFTAKDKDGNHSLVFELESMKCRCNGTVTSCNSFILEPTGEVKINPANPVDYEECDEVRVEAQVVDEYTEKGANNSLQTDEMLIKIIDVNDNYPQFITSDVDSNVFVVVSESAVKGTSVASVTATDRDSGTYGQIKFEVKHVTFEHTNRLIKETDLLFSAVTTQDKNIYSGLIQCTSKLDATLKGKYLVTVAAIDDDGKGLSDSTVLEIFTVDESFRIELRFKSPLEEVEKNEDNIKRDLMAATKATVHIVALTTEKEEARAPGDTIMETYFVNRNGTALTSNQVEDMLSEPEYFLKLAEYGLSYIGTVDVEEPKVNVLQFVMVGMIGGLIIVLTVLTTSLVCTRRNYRRKLKAAKAMNTASMVTSDNQKSGPVLPGTNKYTMEGANPVLNLNIDAAMILDIDAQSSDADKVSLSSLDYSDDMIMSEKDTNPIMQRIQEEEEDERLPEYSEPLGAALAHHGQKKGSRNHNEEFTNPAFSTTDL